MTTSTPDDRTTSTSPRSETPTEPAKVAKARLRTGVRAGLLGIDGTHN